MRLQVLYFYLSKKEDFGESVLMPWLVEAFAGRKRAMGAHFSFPVLTLCVLDESAETLRAIWYTDDIT